MNYGDNSSGQMIYLFTHINFIRRQILLDELTLFAQVCPNGWSVISAGINQANSTAQLSYRLICIYDESDLSYSEKEMLLLFL